MLDNKLVINADDFGRSWSRNEAVRICFEERYITRASLVVNMEASEAAMCLAHVIGRQDDVVFHLNLSEGKPLTERIKNTPFCDENGCFCNLGMSSSIRLAANREVIKALCEECEKQMQVFRGNGFTSSRLDSHRWHHFYLPVVLALRQLARRYGFVETRSHRGHLSMAQNSMKHNLYLSVVGYLLRILGLQENGWSCCPAEFIQLARNWTGGGGGEIYVHPDMIQGMCCETLFSYEIGNSPMPVAKVCSMLKEWCNNG